MRVAIVIPWFGRDLKGGAEQQAWQIAARLSSRGHRTDVLTTCCRSHQHDWATNHLPAGCAEEPEGFVVRRFPVDPRDRPSFDRVCGALLQGEPALLKPGVSPAPVEDSRIFVDELIRSEALLDYLEEQRDNYDWFIFLPYLYGLVIRGIEIVGERSALQPCLHDEPYAYLPHVAEAFRRAGRLLFNSDGELELAVRLMGPGIWEKSHVVGEGVEADGASKNGTGAQLPSTPSAPYVLYLGRKDPEKNVPLLLNAFRRFRSVRPNSKLRLVLAGTGTAEIAPDIADHADDLGLVSEDQKVSLLSNCAALFQPSRNESFSRVIMEAWMYGRPVAAHADCLATSVAVERSGGGWIAGRESEWASLFTTFTTLPADEFSARGANGRRYAESMANWDSVMARYEAVLADGATRRPPPSARVAVRKAINQFLPGLSYGDAISNYALWIRDQLRARGYTSEIYVRFVDPRVAHECTVFSPDALRASDAAIYHHSIGSEITPHLLNYEGSKALIYHNITPAEFFAKFRPDYVPLLQNGRDELSTIARHFPISCGVSQFNAAELAAHGFHDPAIVPIPIDGTKWRVPPDERLMAQLQDGRTNLLFVGRLAPNKKQEDLVRAFCEYLALDPRARLILIGKPEERDPYVAFVQQVISSLGVEDSVLLPGSVSDAELAAYYRCADLFWSMSEHEGFCVPLLEAMWFDVPIFAFKSSAIPETLGEAALLFTEKQDLELLAATAHRLVSCHELRRKLIIAQRKRREHYLPSVVAPVLMQFLTPLLATENCPQNPR